MSVPTIDSNILNVIQSLKPFMNSRALRMSEAAEALLEILGSEPGLKAHQAIKALRVGNQQILPQETAGEGENHEEEKK